MDILNCLAHLLENTSTSRPYDSSSSVVRAPLPHVKQEEKLVLSDMGKIPSKASFLTFVGFDLMLLNLHTLRKTL